MPFADFANARQVKTPGQQKSSANNKASSEDSKFRPGTIANNIELRHRPQALTVPESRNTLLHTPFSSRHYKHFRAKGVNQSKSELYQGRLLGLVLVIRR